MSLNQTSAGVNLEESREQFMDRAILLGIPEYMLESVTSYVYDHRPAGHFLTAVLSNDLREACARADDDNKRVLWEYMFLFHNHVPNRCWGTPEKVLAWLTLGREAREKESQKV